MSNNYSFPTLLDKNGSVTGGKYLVRGIPTTFIIDKEGIILARHSGALTYDQMQDLVKQK
jgi:hypothetical protein